MKKKMLIWSRNIRILTISKLPYGVKIYFFLFKDVILWTVKGENESLDSEFYNDDPIMLRQFKLLKENGLNFTLKYLD